MNKPKHKVGGIVTIDTGWDRQVLCKVTISEVSANHGAKGEHRYWGIDNHKQSRGFYEDEIKHGDETWTRSDWESPL